MASLVLHVLLACNAVVALFLPWIGIIFAYVISVLAPQDIWWWAFSGTRPFYWFMVPTLIGFVIACATGRVSFKDLNTPINRAVLLLWICCTNSYFFGPYVHVLNQYRLFDSSNIFSTLTTAYMTYAVGVALIDTKRKLTVATWIIILTVVYMTYWANAQYFLYHAYGRIHGPENAQGTGIYYDENNLAVLFVVGAPFIYYLGELMTSKVIKGITWLVVLLSWHAIFLTASRGAVIGVVAVLGLFALRSSSKKVSVLVLACFLAAFVLEAGNTMRARFSTISNYQENTSAEGRIDAWKASIGMMEAHPLTGVGVGAFLPAFPDYSSAQPRVAHNTFFQIGGEWGVLAGVTYVVLVVSALSRLKKNSVKLREHKDEREGRFYWAINEACLLALTGFFVCSMFLSLEQYELFYYLLLLSNATLLLSEHREKVIADNIVKALNGASAESGV